jgi:glycosyltransferase involved in cell wall biosynthesis
MTPHTPGRRPHVVLASRVYSPEPVAAAFREQALVHALASHGCDVTVLTTSVPGAPVQIAEARGSHPVEPLSDTDPDMSRAAAGTGGSARGTVRTEGTVRVRRLPAKRDHQGQVRGYVSYLSFDLPLALRLLTTRHVDAIIAEPPPTTGTVVRVLARLRRVPYTFYAADVWSDATDSVEGVPPIIRAVVRGAEVAVWRHAARVLTISPGVQHRVQELVGPRGKLAMVGNGIDTTTFTPDGPDAGETGPYLVYAGTVSEWQGASVFVDAFARVRRQRPDARLLFFSEGTGRDDLEQQVRAQGIEGIEFRDKIPPARVARFLRGARAGLSSITPGQGYEFALPTKIYAATATGTPIIHAGTGAAHDRIAEAGLGWACQYDAEDVARAMLAAIDAADAPSSAHLRRWTLENASLAGCADKAAREVLETLH